MMMEKVICKILCFFLVIHSVLSDGHLGSFWQWTDIHFDPWYHISQESCNREINRVGKYGDFECDSPWSLVKSSVEAMKSLPGGQDVDFILWSGDNVPHIKDEVFYHKHINVQSIMEITRNLTNIIVEAFPDKLILPILGNHDIYPANQFPVGSSQYYDGYAEMWKMWINTQDAQATFKKGGYYSVMINEQKRIRAVVLNSNLHHKGNKLTEYMDDPADQFSWFDSTMNMAKINGEKVLVFTHIPTGKEPEGYSGAAWLVSSQNTKYVKQFVRYSDIILGIFSGHAHHDIFKLHHDDNDNPKVPKVAMFVPPSITPRRSIIDLDADLGTARNPALRLVTFDKNTYEPVDIKQYSMDLVKSNRNMKTEWKLLYSFAETYGIKNISVPELNKALQEFKKFDSRTFHQFYKLFTVNTDHYSNSFEGRDPNCDSCECKTRFLCSIEHQIYEHWDECERDQETCYSAPYPPVPTSAIVVAPSITALCAWVVAVFIHARQ